MKKSVQSTLVLVAICAVMAVLLALTNSITAPIIKQNQEAAANEALLVVMPEGEGFEKMDLTTYELPATVTELGNYAFYRCEGLKTVELGNVQRIGSFAFYGDFSITSIVIPRSLKVIGKQAFRNCKGLTAVMLPESLETVEQHAFYGCSSLTLYLAFSETPAGWHKYWNSSYRPAVYGCALSEDNSYVIYVEKGTVANLNSSNSLSDPIREGYTFAGWGNSATATAPSFTSANLSEAEAGKRLYAIWDEK